MRNEFIKNEIEKRSRKRVTLYAGKEAVFAMSEGNPRKLLGLLNDISDLNTYDNPRCQSSCPPHEIGFQIISDSAILDLGYMDTL